MAKKVATILGIGFLLVGLIGFISPHFLGTHLSMAHTIVHLLSGAIALYLGLKGTPSQAKTFCLVFGLVYALLGVGGFLLGSQGSPSAGVPGPSDDRLWKVIPGTLELGTMDHIIHILLGAIFLIGGLLDKRDVARATD